MSFTASSITADADLTQYCIITGSGQPAYTLDSLSVYIPLGSPQYITFTGSINPAIITSFGPSYSQKFIGNDNSIYFQILNDDDGNIGDLNITNIKLNIVQTTALSAAENDEILFSPLIDIPNFYNSDYNPTINNGMDNRLSLKYLDIDYTTGMNEPVNLDLLLDGDGTRASIQDSNYSTIRHITPRYIGCKNTSEKINEWTTSSLNSGNYGKTPSIESLKTSVAYCESAGGYAPDRMDVSSATVKYIINQDGTIQDPKSSPNVLQNLQGLFQTGERLIINENIDKPKKIIKGGYRIVPILYNQIGHYLSDGYPIWLGSSTNYLTFESRTPTTPIQSIALQTTGSVLGKQFINSGSGVGWENSIYISGSTSFHQYYSGSSTNENTFYQYGFNIYTTSSGFEPFDLPVSFEPGDEFRFDGVEANTFMIISSSLVTNPLNPALNNVIKIVLNKPIPSSFCDNISTGNILNKFVLRRYVPDPDSIIFEGLKDPSNAQGPFILKPEFVVPELNKGISEFITDLTQKGLI